MLHRTLCFALLLALACFGWACAASSVVVDKTYPTQHDAVLLMSAVQDSGQGTEKADVEGITEAIHQSLLRCELFTDVTLLPRKGGRSVTEIGGGAVKPGTTVLRFEVTATLRVEHDVREVPSYQLRMNVKDVATGETVAAGSYKGRASGVYATGAAARRDALTEAIEAMLDDLAEQSLVEPSE